MQEGPVFRKDRTGPAALYTWRDSREYRYQTRRYGDNSGYIVQRHGAVGYPDDAFRLYLQTEGDAAAAESDVNRYRSSGFRSNHRLSDLRQEH